MPEKTNDKSNSSAYWLAIGTLVGGICLYHSRSMSKYAANDAAAAARAELMRRTLLQQKQKVVMPAIEQQRQLFQQARARVAFASGGSTGSHSSSRFRYRYSKWGEREQLNPEEEAEWLSSRPHFDWRSTSFFAAPQTLAALKTLNLPAPNLNNKDPLTLDALKIAFKARAMETHPDVAGAERSEEFREVVEAYELLQDGLEKMPRQPFTQSQQSQQQHQA